MSTRFKRTADRNLNERHTQILRECLQQPENKYCADCKKKDPRWASWNLGIFVCIRCSGTHRSMGTHISRVKSVDLDTWTPEQVENMVRWGNAKANIYWEANLKLGSYPPESNIDQWIRSKYEMKRWATKGPIPDPNTLGNGFSANVADTSAKNLATSKPRKVSQDEDDIFISSNDSKSSTVNNSSSVLQLKGAELFSLGKPVSASSAPSSPTQKKALLPSPRSTTPNPIPTASSPHDTLKSSILSLYNSPTLRPVAINQLQAPAYGRGNLTLDNTINRPADNQNNFASNFYAMSSAGRIASLPQGGQFFATFQSNHHPTISGNEQQKSLESDDPFGDLMDFTKFQ
jgi:stromal membrane-associated protein